MYSISKLVVDPDGYVVALDWSYSNEDGSLGNRLFLAKPYGATPLRRVTEEDTLSWLTSQLPNSEEEFIAQLRAQAESKAREAEMVDYAITESGPVLIAD